MLYPIQNQTRDLLCLDGLWQFTANGKTQELAVPASWNEQDSDLFDYCGVATYCKKVFVPRHFAGRKVWLRFGGVSTNTLVKINGVEAGRHQGVSLPFECDATDLLQYGTENTIDVIVDNTLDPWALPPASLQEGEGRIGFVSAYPAVTYDFYPFGGIHRSVFLYSTAPTRIQDVKIDAGMDRVASFCIYLSEPLSGSVEVSVAGVTVCCTATNQDCIRGSITVINAKLWDVGQPNLYDMNITISNDNGMPDTYAQSFGFRTVTMGPRGIVLNGKEVFLKGFGKHEDFDIIGKGFNNAVMVKDYTLLNWIGANSFRTSHYPYDEQMLDYADRHGMLIIDETPFVGLNDRMYTDEILETAKGRVQELIERDYNHPCVIAWSLANEPTITVPEGKSFFKGLYDTAHELDTTRPITYVGHMEPENNQGYEYYDFVCINKYYGWYIGAGQIDATLDGFSDCLDRFYEAFGKPVMITEFGADAIAGMHNMPAQMFSEEYQAEIIEKQYRLYCTKPYAMGAHVWAFADFKTNQTISRIILNRKGVFTRDRKPKMAAHMLKKLWAE